jgi:hypothetical protein
MTQAPALLVIFDGFGLKPRRATRLRYHARITK